MKTWHWLALAGGAYYLYYRHASQKFAEQATAVIDAAAAAFNGPNNAAPTAESANYTVPSQTVPRVPLTAGTPDVQVIPPKADGSVAFVIPGRVNPSFSSYNGDYANGQPAGRLASQ